MSQVLTIYRIPCSGSFSSSLVISAISARQRSVTKRIPLPLVLAIRRFPAPHSATYKYRPLSTTSKPRFCQDRMASDEDYMSFLDKANRDLSDGEALAETNGVQTGRAVSRTTDAGARAPRVIREACENAFFVTDADEPFVEVSLRWNGDGLPDEADFAKLAHLWDGEYAEISIMDPLDWDPQGRYVKLIEAVREATRGNDVRVYRMARDECRVEYWLLSREQGRLVGVKALGVES